MRTTDRIVEEVHAVRDAIARKSGYDLDQIINAAKARQVAGGQPVVRLAPKRTTTTKETS